LQLFEQNAELINARSALAQKSQMEERLRIAGDLHDSIGHQLTALRLQLEALSQIVPAEIKPKVANSQQLSRDLLDNIRDIVKRMSRDEPTDLGSLIQQIDSDTPGVAVTLVTSIPELDVALQQQLISCIKEGVSNAIRHGRADKIDIKFGDNSVWIDDNGKGVDANHATGFGLNNLKQRLAPFEGKIELGSRNPSGCRLIIRWETAIDGDLVQ
jgi:two-component system, NarL family, sensor histidine kinase DesK